MQPIAPEPRSDVPARPTWASRLAYPGILATAVLAAHVAMLRGVAAGPATGAVVLTAAVAIGALEVMRRHADAWTPTRRGFALDLVHSLVTGYAIAPAIRATLLVMLAGAGAAITHETGAALWPAHWPVLAQLVLAVLVADLGAYSAHRFMHATSVGWRVHAVHHSPTRLNFIASARSHPFNVVLTLSCETGPLIVLGASPEALALWTVVKATNGILQHSNVALTPDRWLSRVLATNEVHRWHHSVDLDESNRNFGNTTMIWDQIFGTFFLPADRRPGLAVGIAGASIPERYLAHLATPFLLDRYERNASHTA